MNYYFTEVNKIGISVLKSFARDVSILGLFLFVLFASAISAQNTVTGAFQGDVSSRTGEIVTTAVVIITNIETGTPYNLTTDSQGRFYQGLLAPGFYRIQVTAPGYRTQLLRREIKVSLTGDVVPVPVRLEPEPPVVPGATPVPPPTVPEEANNIRVEINTTDGRRDGSFREEELRKLPLGGTTITRTFDELALLLPGIAPPPQTIGDVAGPGVGPGVGSAGQFSANGLRSRGNNFTVDGSDNNDEDIGVRRQGFVALTSQPIESVQEYQVITLLAPAQFGRNIGAQVNAVSKQGSTDLHGTLYGFFNSNHLNARNFFDTTNGNDSFALRTQSGQTVLLGLGEQPLMVRNRSGEEDSFTFGQAGGTFGGAIIRERLFYFLAGEYQKINAVREKSFAVPTVEQRGAFGTGARGINVDFFNNSNPQTPLRTPLFPTSAGGNAIFSLFPFANNPSGIYGANTFTQVLPSSGRGAILSGRLDDNFEIGGKQQRLTGRYNFTDDERQIPSVNEAIFSTLLSKIRTQNLSLFLNSQLNNSTSGNQLFNQVRLSFGRTRLNFDEVRDTEFLIPSDELPDVPFLLNAPVKANITPLNGQPTFLNLGRILTTESSIGPVGQVIINGFSPLGVDVYNFPQNRVNNTYQLADELTRRSSRHVAVFGVDTRRTDLISNLPRLARTLITFNGSPRLVPRAAGTQCPNGGPASTTLCFLPNSDPRAVIRPEDLVALGAASNSLLTFNVDRPDSKVNLRFYQLNFYGQDTWRVSPELSVSYGLRYEYNTPVKEVDNLIEETFSDERLSLVPALERLINNRSQLYKPDYNNFAPRIGIAYSRDIFGGNRLSVFRGGYGIFYDQILGAVANQSKNVFPTFLTVNLGGVMDAPGQFLSIFNPAAFTANGVLIRQPGTVNSLNNRGFSNAGITFANFLLLQTGMFPNAINVTLPTEKLEMPMAHHYSFTFEQQLNANLTASVGYVGTSGRNLLRFTTPNLGSSLTVVPTGFETIVPGDLPFPQVNGSVLIPQRPLNRIGEAGIGTVNQFETTASSIYNSLQAQLLGRFSDKINFQLSYTFSKVTDDVSDVFDLAGASVLPQNSFDLEAERAPANFDVRHRLAYNLVYNFKNNEGSGFFRYLTDDLQISSTGRYHSGQPFTVNSVIDVNLDGNLTDRLNSTQGIETTGDRSQPLRLMTVNTTSLLAPFGQDGQVGRNSFRAGNVVELDLSILKPFVFGSRRLTFRTDIFNFINRANFGVPVRLLEAPGFGRATNTVTPGRRVQFSLKYEF